MSQKQKPSQTVYRVKVLETLNLYTVCYRVNSGRPRTIHFLCSVHYRAKSMSHRTLYLPRSLGILELETFLETFEDVRQVVFQLFLDLLFIYTVYSLQYIFSIVDFCRFLELLYLSFIVYGHSSAIITPNMYVAFFMSCYLSLYIEESTVLIIGKEVVQSFVLVLIDSGVSSYYKILMIIRWKIQLTFFHS